MLGVESAIEGTWSGDRVKVIILVLRHLLLNLFGSLEFASFERIGAFGEQVHHLVIVESQLDVGDSVEALSILVTLFQPSLYLLLQGPLK